MMQFSTKSEILSQLKPLLKKAHILPQVRFTVEEWHEKSEAILNKIKKAAWSCDPLVVRSSAIQEDGIGESKAGEYESVLNVQGENDLKRAIKTVIDSFEDGSLENQVFIQPMLKDISLSGVAFSKDPSSSAPYFILNYDDSSGSTASVTGGATNELKTFIHYKYAKTPPPKPLDRIISLIQELESLFSVDGLDVEFAITKKGELFLFQVRPLVLKVKSPVGNDQIQSAIQNMERKLREISSAHPYLHGSKGVYGVMPDWNPAEIIGIRPKPLALSLYKEIITDSIWAYQRDNYGYRNLRSFPLMLTFCGIPFIDVRVSFNSFIPHDLSSSLAERLVNYYISRLEQYPNFHDKVEFEIIYSCYTLDLPERLQTLDAYGFNASDRALLSESLRKLTNRIIDPDSGLWKKDLEKIEELKARFDCLMQNSMEPISKIYWLIEDCKRYGTLPFAGLARAGFIAIQLLKSLVATGILTSSEYAAFLASLNTISSELALDFYGLSKTSFLQKYGHLRPGTYDILSPRYDEAPDLYFNWEDPEHKNHTKKVEFSLTLTQMKQIESHLKHHKLNHNVITFFEFLKSAIEGREYAKFYFTKNLSFALSQIAKLCLEEGIENADAPFLNFSVFKKLYGSSEDCRSNLMQSIEEGKKSYEITKQILLPPLITDPGQVWSFHLPLSEPNFITLKTALGPVAHLSAEKKNLEKAILFIPSADPGFDWIFSHQIAGFVTMYGGVNSHMAIRSAELQIPAVIGAGESLYREWSRAKILEIDAGSKQVKIIR